MPPTTDRAKAARRAPPRLAPPITAAAAVLALAAAAPGRAAVEESYTPGEPPITTTWFAAVSDAARRADRGYLAGMRPHHAGALSMSREYLADPGRSSPLLQALARAIIANQGFEIGVLDAVGRDLDRPPLRLPFGVGLQPVATEGLAGARRFFREPMPSEVSYAVGPVTERDVQFVKAMTVHHQAAVDMARAYQADPDARNGYLGLLNVDIVTDQTQEIALMRRAVAAFPGDPDAVRVDPSMVHGMEGMGHGRHGGGGHAPPSAAAGAAQPARAAGAAERPDHAAHGRHPRADHDGHAGSAPAPEPSPPRSKPAPRRPAAAAHVGEGDHRHAH